MVEFRLGVFQFHLEVGSFGQGFCLHPVFVSVATLFPSTFTVEIFNVGGWLTCGTAYDFYQLVSHSGCAW